MQPITRNPHQSAWLGLWELGRSFAIIADTFSTHVHLVIGEDVALALKELTVGLLPPQVRRIPALPTTKEKARERRDYDQDNVMGCPKAWTGAVIDLNSCTGRCLALFDAVFN